MANDNRLFQRNSDDYYQSINTNQAAEISTFISNFKNIKPNMSLSNFLFNIVTIEQQDFFETSVSLDEFCNYLNFMAQKKTFKDFDTLDAQDEINKFLNGTSEIIDGNTNDRMILQTRLSSMLINQVF